MIVECPECHVKFRVSGVRKIGKKSPGSKRCIARQSQICQTKRQKLTIQTASQRGNRWTPQEDEYIRTYCNTKSIKEIAIDLNRTLFGVNTRGMRLGCNFIKPESKSRNMEIINR